MAEVSLDSVSVEAVAQRVAELLAGSRPDCLLTAAELAERFHLSRDYVYEHADELGAIRLGDGPRARLRFDPGRAVEALAPKPFPTPRTRSVPPKRRASTADLLPIRKDRS